MFEQPPSAVYCELPVVKANGPPVNENSEDHVSNIYNTCITINASFMFNILLLSKWDGIMCIALLQ